MFSDQDMKKNKIKETGILLHTLYIEMNLNIELSVNQNVIQISG